ncbi:hypothetical protein NA56DRAFT_725907 [Hyaloscypha hepaticicola]|uniref:Uncharacterized protein n=1 Tax=Hyaloscypha hepaticicola TaxID=2082293 RepID=A0A2J6QLH7_9HELO|nr:hypothetical protein NA56DRAFT_725907 [Hyaloscypha hepaticicola]
MSTAPQNAHGQGISHATDHSKVPEKIQEAAPASLERKLPENVHPTGDSTHNSDSTNVSHAKGGGEASIVPQKLQEKLPESVEKAVPNAIHDTRDEGGLHRKQH